MHRFLMLIKLRLLQKTQQERLNTAILTTKLCMLTNQSPKEELELAYEKTQTSKTTSNAFLMKIWM